MLIKRFKIVMASPPPSSLAAAFNSRCLHPPLSSPPPPSPTPAALGSRWPHRGDHEMWGTGGSLGGGGQPGYPTGGRARMEPAELWRRVWGRVTIEGGWGGWGAGPGRIRGVGQGEDY